MPAPVDKIATTDNTQEYLKQQNIKQGTLTSGTNIAWDMETAQNAKLTLAHNATLDNPTNQMAGATYQLIIIQDATGGRTFAFGTNYTILGGGTINTTANKRSVLTCTSLDGTELLCTIVSE